MEQAHRISVLCDTHAIPILMHLSDNGPCSRTEIYRTVGRNANMPKKLIMLEDAGLIRMDVVGNAGLLSLTDTGRKVARKLRDIESLLSGHRH